MKSSMGERASGWRKRDLEKKRIRAMNAGQQYHRNYALVSLTFSELSIHLTTKNVE